MPDTEHDAVTRRYDRIARFYDLTDKRMDLLGVGSRRKRLFSQAKGRTLDVGVGTGRNLSLYPDGSTRRLDDRADHRVQHCSALGPTKGGTRFRPGVHLDDGTSLATSMTWRPRVE